MTKREIFQISFKKSISGEWVNFFALTTNSDYYDIARHLTNSDKTNTIDQINSIENAMGRLQKGLAVNEFWGELFGSPLYIYPETNNVIVGIEETSVTITDFKELLQEWLAFIS